MKDNDGLAKVCLFSKNAEMNYEEGDVVQITSVYPKQFLNMPQLTTTSESRCQVTNFSINLGALYFYFQFSRKHYLYHVQNYDGQILKK